MLHICRIKLQLQTSRKANFEIYFYIFYLSVDQTILDWSVFSMESGAYPSNYQQHNFG